MDGQRLSALDALRGLALAAMFLAAYPGAGAPVFAALKPAEWNGWTAADLIFPCFLLVVGASLAFSLSRRREERGGSYAVYLKVLERSVVLFALGLFLEAFPFFRLGGLRIPGVLQRIAVCYLVASLIYLRAGARERLGAVAALVVGYWLALKLIRVPGFGAGVLSPAGNLPGYLDAKLLPGHLLERAFDPDGILSTASALGTTLIGTLVGDLLRSTRTLSSKVRLLFGLGVVLSLLGLFLDRWMPINEKLWTSTFVLFTAGVTLLLLGAFFFLMENIGWTGWAFPLLVFGSNSILAYAGSLMTVKLLGLVGVSTAAGRVPLPAYVCAKALVLGARPELASLAWPFLLIVVWFLVLLPFYKKKIFVRV